MNALSIDAEDWYHPELVRARLVGTGERLPQVSRAILPILDLLDKYNVRATFFILGEVAQLNPALVEKIYAKGHEIASHGMDHRPLWELDKKSFAGQLDDFSKLIKNIIGADFQIKGFRAPSFSLDKSTMWAFEVLKEKGYKYDSSIFPFKNRFYGVKDAPLEIYRPSAVDLCKNDPAGGILEFPMAVYDCGSFRIPVSGGFYFRLMPFFMIKKLLKKINNRRPFIFYIHPWECDEFTPRVKGLQPAEYFITYYGISGVLKKLECLLTNFSFRPVCEVLNI